MWNAKYVKRYLYTSKETCKRDLLTVSTVARSHEIYIHQKRPAQETSYGVASVSRIDKIIGLFCKRALSKRLHSAQATYNLSILLTVATQYLHSRANSLPTTAPFLPRTYWAPPNMSKNTSLYIKKRPASQETYWQNLPNRALSLPAPASLRPRTYWTPPSMSK